MRWRVVAAAWLAVGVAAGLAPAGDDDGPAAETVQAAVRRGLRWLAAQQRPDGTFGAADRTFAPVGPEPDLMVSGRTALAALALVRAGVDAREPAVQRAFEALAVEPTLTGTYSDALALLAFEALHAPSKGTRSRPADRAARRVERAQARLVEQQLPAGPWGYGGPAAARPSGYFDHSNTQFALLGLAAAERLGRPAPVETWTRAAEHLLAAQERDGPAVEPFDVPAAATRAREAAMRARGWSYFAADRAGLAYRSMTASGVVGLVLVKARAARTAWWKVHGERVDAAIRDGTAWLGLHLARPTPLDRSLAAMLPADGGFRCYELYSVERVGAATGAERLGGRSWYAQGASELLPLQRADGSWDGDFGGPTVSTAFALLFLARATPPPLPDLPPQRVETGR